MSRIIFLKPIVCIGIDFLEEKNNFYIVDKKTVNFIERRRRRADSMVSFEKKDTDITAKIFCLFYRKDTLKLKYKDHNIDVVLSKGFRPINILENMKFQMDINIQSTAMLNFSRNFVDFVTEYLKRFLGKIKNTDSITHYVWDENYWDDISCRKKRKLSTISLNETSNELLSEVKDFLSPNRRTYENLGVNYKRITCLKVSLVQGKLV